MQTVSKDQNPRYWSLIKAFGDRTGVPMLLNTSFNNNNNEEPIVDSVEDAIVCYLTTELDYLVVWGLSHNEKGAASRERWGPGFPSFPAMSGCPPRPILGTQGVRRYEFGRRSTSERTSALTGIRSGCSKGLTKGPA